MRKRDSSGPGGRKKPASGTGRSSGRSGARSKSSREDKPFSRTRGSHDDSKPKRTTRSSRPGEDDSKDFSKSQGGKTFGRSSDKPSGFSKSTRGGKSFESREDKPFTRSRDDRNDSKPIRSSKYLRTGGEDSKDSLKPSRDEKSFGRSGKSLPSFSKSPREGKTFSSRSEKPFSSSRDEKDETKPTRSTKFSGSERDSKDSAPREKKSFDSTDKPSDKKGFFSKLSRGGKSFEKTKRHDTDFGKSVKDYSAQPKEEEKEAAQLDSGKIRLNRYISNSGVCSRREADNLITMGLVSVNGTVITEMGHKVNRNDVIKYDGKTLRAEKHVYILINKPKGFLTTTKDPQERNTVMQIIAGAVKERVYPVGRLDRNTTGILLLTNDGELTDKLSHPSYNVKKIYKVELDKPLSKADYLKIKEGVYLEEGRAVVDDLAIVSEDGKTIGIEIHIGWNRIIRRIFESLEYVVVKLDRSVYAGLDKKDLSRGHWRFLSTEEVVRLKHYK